MSKKVLAIYYSQSGQMSEIIDRFTQPLIDASAQVEKVRIKPAQDFAFPWNGERFFSVMPDCVLGNPHPLEPLNLQQTHYDLIILGYQPWFLSPSIPSNSLLNNPEFKEVLKDTPVVTISAARNMWLNAFDRIRKALADAGANHVGNVALFDKHHNAISFITIFYWMLTGKRDRYLNIFPKPGIADQDIEQTTDFGRIVAQHFEKENYDGMQQELVDLGAVQIVYKLMFIEARAKSIFAAWAKIITKRKNRKPWLSAFKYYLFVALFLGAPVLLTLDAIFLRPFSSKRISKKKNRYLLLN